MARFLNREKFFWVFTLSKEIVKDHVLDFFMSDTIVDNFNIWLN